MGGRSRLRLADMGANLLANDRIKQACLRE